MWHQYNITLTGGVGGGGGGGGGEGERCKVAPVGEVSPRKEALFVADY